MASRYGRLEIVRTLLEYGANVEAKSKVRNQMMMMMKTIMILLNILMIMMMMMMIVLCVSSIKSLIYKQFIYFNDHYLHIFQLLGITRHIFTIILLYANHCHHIIHLIYHTVLVLLIV